GLACGSREASDSWQVRPGRGGARDLRLRLCNDEIRQDWHGLGTWRRAVRVRREERKLYRLPFSVHCNGALTRHSGPFRNRISLAGGQALRRSRWISLLVRFLRGWQRMDSSRYFRGVEASRETRLLLWLARRKPHSIQHGT